MSSASFISVTRRPLEFAVICLGIGELIYRLSKGDTGLRCARIQRRGVIDYCVMRGVFRNSLEWDSFIDTDPQRPHHPRYFDRVRMAGRGLLR